MTAPLNREQKRALKKAGQMGEDGAPTPGRDRRAPAALAKEARTSPAQFLREVRAELKKVAWPTRPEMIRYSIIVLVAILIVTIWVSGVDWAFLKFFHDLVFGTGTSAAPAGGVLPLGT